jgi:hypothetical protein
MAGSDKPERRSTNGHRRPVNGSSASIRTANLSTPDFDESWKAGAPLNWVDFVDHWNRDRVPGPENERANDDG